MTEITDLSVTDSSNTSVTGESLDGSIANMGRMDNTLQAVMGLLARSIRTNVLRFLDNTDPTKKVKLDLSGLPTATERTWTAPYYSGTLGLVSDIRGHIYGLTLSNNVTDATNDIDIAAGSAVDTTGVVSMLLASGLTKRLDAAWAVGTNQGGRMSAAAIANTTYHVFLIRRPDTGVVDVGFDVSPTAPTLPANYTQFRRIGSIKRISGTILAFWQNGRYFELVTPVQTLTATGNFGTAAVTRPTSAVDLAIPVRIMVRSGSASGATNTRYSSFNTADVAAASGNSQSVSTPTYFGVQQFDVVVNTSNEFRERRDFSAADSFISIITVGWTDTAL